jgi:selenide,water dikinase
MGAEPFMALNIACLPIDLSAEIVLEVFNGLAAKVKEAGAVIAGGHSIQDEEPKVGLVALGFAHPDHLMTKAEAKVGDRLVLTKPIGTGVTATAIKAGEATEADIQQAVGWMSGLNRRAAKIAKDMNLAAATDITGFSLLGHGMEMADSSQVRLRFDAPAVPVLPGAVTYASRGFIPGGTIDNQAHFEARVEFDGTMPAPWVTLLFDAQTSGGLLLAVAEEKLEGFMEIARTKGQPAWVIGAVEAGRGVRVTQEGSPEGVGAEGDNLAFLSA